MASPFDAFRNNRPLLVGLFGLAMFSFVALGVADPSNIGAFMPLIAGIVVGGALWYASGKGGGEGATIAAVGAVIGFVVYSYVPTLTAASDALVLTDAGDLGPAEIEAWGRDRAIADQFIALARNQAVANGAEDLPPWETFYGRNVPRTVPEQRQRLLELFLLNAEADRLGIAIDDDGVNELINRLTARKLTGEGFAEARRGLGVSTNEIYDALRKEARALRAFNTLRPRYAPTPDSLWDLHRKANVRQSLELATFPVSAFVASVEEPSEAEVTAFFNQYRAAFPDQLGPGEPGFRVPRQVQLAYVKASFEDALDDVEPVTDADVEAFYEANKSVRYIDRSAGAGAEGTPSETEAGPALRLPAESDGSSGEGEEPEPTEAGESNASEEPSPENASAETAVEETETEAPAEPSPETEAAGAETSDAEVPETENPEAETPEVETPETETPEVDAPAAEAPAAETSALPTTPVTAFAQVADDLPAIEPGEPAASTEFEEIYLPLDDDLRDEIADELERLRAFDLVASRIAAAQDEMGRIVIDTFADVNLGEIESDETAVRAKARTAYRAAVREAIDRLMAFAGENELEFVKTDWVAYDVLRNAERYAIGNAVDPSGGSFGGQRRTVADESFSDLGLRTPVAKVAEEPGGGTRYAYWKTDDREASLPSLDDEGMRDRVIAAWKTKQARPRADERAEAFLASLREDGPLGDALAGEDGKAVTVTGAEGGESLNVTVTAPFSALRRTSAPSPFGFPLPTLEPGEIPGLGPVPAEVMDDLFATEVGGTTSFPAPDGSAVHVARVRDRTAQSEGDRIALKQEFLGEGVFTFTSPYAAIMNRRQQALAGAWFASLESRYNVQFTDAAGSVN